MIYDRTIVRLEEQLEQAKGLLQFFTAYVASRPDGHILVTDEAMMDISDGTPAANLLCIGRDEARRGTRIGIKPKTRKGKTSETYINKT